MPRKVAFPRCGNRIYRIWRAMHFRCYQPLHEAYPRYGGRGITVCEEWHNFDVFCRWALASGYADDLEIDRRDNDKGYTPDNSRWGTRSQNQRNRRNNLAPIQAFGEAKKPIEWSEDPRCQVSWHLLRKRLEKGWAPVAAITVPPQKGKRPISMRRGAKISPAQYIGGAPCP